MGKILVIAATSREIECINKIPVSVSGKEIKSIVGGVGPVSTVYSLMDYFLSFDIPDIVINIGIAGSYDKKLSPGTVIVPVTDCFADLGVYDGSRFIPLSRTGLKKDNDNLTSSDLYMADSGLLKLLPDAIRHVKAVTVNATTGSKESRERISAEFNPDIETMEGAAVYYTCNMKNIPCLGIRSVSNLVGPRDIASWDINTALSNLGETVTSYINKIAI